jgi:hypothetical protein
VVTVGVMVCKGERRRGRERRGEKGSEDNSPLPGNPLLPLPLHTLFIVYILSIYFILFKQEYDKKRKKFNVCSFFAIFSREL